jgi:hypothetical protein
MLFVASLSFCVPWRSNFDKLASARQPAIFVVVLKVFVSRKGENSGYESIEGKTGRTADQFLRPNRTTHFFIERISNTRTVWSRDPLVSSFPCGAHARACMVFCGDDRRHCISAFYPIPIPETYSVKSAVPVRGWASLHVLDDSYVSRKNRLLQGFCKRPDAHSRDVAGCSEALVIRHGWQAMR